MSDIQARIRQAATKNAELLQMLSSTDHAIPDLDNQNRYIADLENQAAAAARRITELERRHTKELKDHEKYRDSVMRRFAFKATGKREKFEERAAKEEREYFDVLQEEHREKEMKKNLDGILGEARNARASLQNEADKHNNAQQMLNNLYNDIFQGPTPGFPEEDAREQEASQALQAYQETRGKAEAEGQAVRILEDGMRWMKGAQEAMQDALKYSTRDMWGGGTFTDMMERNALSQAELNVTEARMRVAQAQRMSPGIRDLPRVQIAQGNMISDVFFDNIFTDMAFHEKIEASTAEVRRCTRDLEGQIQVVRSRHLELARNQSEKERALNDARTVLQKAREAAFQRVLGGEGGQGGSDPPPAYSS